MPELQYYLDRIPGDAPAEVRKRMIKEARHKVRQDVFGHDYKTDKYGRPIEDGIGSKANPSQSSIDAYIKHQTERRVEPEEGYADYLKQMKAELAAFKMRQAKLKNEEDDGSGDD